MSYYNNMANSLGKQIPYAIIYTTMMVFLIDYIFLTNLPTPLPNLFMFLIYSAILFGIYGFIISRNASLNKCDRSNKKRSTYHAMKTVLSISVTYIVVYMFNTFRFPFNELIGEGNLGNAVAESFYLSLVLALVSISNAYESAELTCKIKPWEIKENLKPLDKYLDKKYKKKREKMIKVTD